MQANITIQFSLEREDYTKLNQACKTLEDIRHEFEKCGIGYSEEDIEALKRSAHIIDEILRGEVF